MSSLPEALPLALAASFSPPAILVLILLLTGEQPRRLVFAYLAGAALLVGGIGVGGLFLLTLTGATQQDSRSASDSIDLVLGAALLVLAVWSWRRRGRPPGQQTQEGTLAKVSLRASTSVKWAFAAGILVYLFSPLYFAAIKVIADSGDSTVSQLLAVLVCAACVLVFVEIPAVVLLVRPDGLRSTLERMSNWLSTNSWLLVAVLAGAAGTWLLVTAISALR